MHSPHRIHLDSQPNFRDIGGYKGADGSTVRTGLVYRSGNLDKLTDADRDTIKQLGIRTVIDFRSASEAQADESYWSEQGAKYIHLPIDPGNLATLFWEAMRTGDSSALPEDILSVNNHLVIKEASSQYGELFKHLRNPHNLPLLFNCTHGKDRTGIAAVLVLLALGVSNEESMFDYLLSNTFRDAENKEELNALSESVKDKPGIDLKKLEAAFTLLPKHFGVILDTVEELHGNLGNYFREALGLGEQEIAALRSNLLEY